MLLQMLCNLNSENIYIWKFHAEAFEVLSVILEHPVCLYEGKRQVR